MESSLEKYKEKRDFKETPEPKGKKAGKGKNVFVVQKHDARNLHYDLRLEAGGVLKSWAIPKGPSLDPKQRRLAIETEDHPLDYADFEGTIPEGSYGAGTVMVWDKGKYINISEDKRGKSLSFQQAYKKGHISVELRGQKLRGGFGLIKTQDGKWLLVKSDDDEADARRNMTKSEPNSVKTGRSFEEIRKEES